ncbi:MAG: LLM class flavin-dependent oxidoreductase [Bacteroidia bacterium]|nr:LLM class flavin-dependent oxidoreductase [Bacteroidia bacterium]
MRFELGIYTFGEATYDPEMGRAPTPAERLQRLIEEAEVADEAGLSIYAVGEHHRPEYVVSTPSVVLAALAARTRKIRLSSAVVVLGSADPIRVFQEFATVDLLSNGRAELMVGRGSFTESFPLFGYDLSDYDELFEEKLELLLKIREEEIVFWPGGRFTHPIPNLGVYPRSLQRPLPVWLAVGGTPGSMERAAKLGLPVSLAIIGGSASRFKPLVDMYKQRSMAYGNQARLGIAAHGFIARSRREAQALAFPAHKLTMDRIGRERGWPPFTWERFLHECRLDGALFVGEPAEIVDKILYQHSLFRHERLIIQLTVGTIPHKAVLEAIELLGTEVLPAVEKALDSCCPLPASV